MSRGTLVVAGLSARLMAEAAARDGYEVIALDAFGDVDTQRAARRWVPIGADRGVRIDPARTLAALQDAAAEPSVLGWIAGSGFEGQPELIGRGAQRLPLIGTPADAVQRVRDPAGFFGMLDWLGLPHPDVDCDPVPPDPPEGWLRKLGGGTGGWHIRAADDRHPADPDDRPYFQRVAPGTPMSALFFANARSARLVAINELLVRPLGAHPYVYRGAIGPVALPEALAVGLETALDTLSAAFGLRGLCSLDFLCDGDRWSLLEINPRPSASIALYAQRPWMHEHVAACTADALPAADATPTPASPPRGTEIVFARTAFTLSDAQAAALAAHGDCHDLPAAGSRHAPGDPVCSVEAAGPTPDDVRAQLARRRAELRAAFATP